MAGAGPITRARKADDSAAIDGKTGNDSALINGKAADLELVFWIRKIAAKKRE